MASRPQRSARSPTTRARVAAAALVDQSSRAADYAARAKALVETWYVTGDSAATIDVSDLSVAAVQIAKDHAASLGFNAHETVRDKRVILVITGSGSVADAANEND